MTNMSLDKLTYVYGVFHFSNKLSYQCVSGTSLANTYQIKIIRNNAVVLLKRIFNNLV